MKALLVTGDSIRDQIWMTDNDRMEAVQLHTLIQNPEEPFRWHKIKILPHDTEYVRSEELTFDQLQCILTAILTVRLFRL